MEQQSKIVINKDPSFYEVWHEGYVEHDNKKHYFWLIHPQHKDDKEEPYELEVRWFFGRVPREVRAMYPSIIEAFKQTLKDGFLDLEKFRRGRSKF